MNLILDILLLLVFLFAAYRLFRLGKIRKQNRLLYKSISLFILLHLIIFPLIYLFIINIDPASIEIDNQILSLERQSKLNSLETNYGPNDLDHQIRIIDDILTNEKVKIKEEDFSWENDVEFDEETQDQNFIGFMFLKNYTLTIQTKYLNQINDKSGKFLMIYPERGYKTFEIHTGDFDKNLNSVLIDNLELLKKNRNKMIQEFKTIKSNKFWSYRQILPYSFNILFVDNFKPKSKLANIIHPIHNFIVLGFLLSFVVGFTQESLVRRYKNENQ